MNLAQENSSPSQDIEHLYSLIKSCGPILSLFGASSYSILKSNEDPFLVYYTIVSLFFVSGVWIIMTKTSDKSQKYSSLLWFLFTTVAAVIAVYWRYDRIERFLFHEKNIIYCPTGICDGAHDYPPYFILLGAVILFSLLVIIRNTGSQVNSKNRAPILIVFIVMLFFLLACRYAWDKVDDYGIKRACPICKESSTNNSS